MAGCLALEFSKVSNPIVLHLVSGLKPKLPVPKKNFWSQESERVEFYTCCPLFCVLNLRKNIPLRGGKRDTNCVRQFYLFAGAHKLKKNKYMRTVMFSTNMKML